MGDGARLRSLFFGTPEFAVPCLEALHEISEIAAVVCQPDRPAGRGNVIHAPPVKERALALGLEVVQPTKLKDGTFAAWAREQNVDVGLVVAYGRILPKAVLDAPRRGCVNVHASLLPKLRGAAPITWAVVRGEKETGVTLMQMDEGMDTGPVLERLATPILDHETAGELGERLSALGALATRKGVTRWVAGDYLPEAQDGALATLAPILTKEDGRVDFSKSARAVHDHVRGMSPWPGAFTLRAGKKVKILATTILAGSGSSAVPGTVVLCDKSRLGVACGEGAVLLETIQLEGKNPVSGADWFRGRGVAEGDLIGA